MTKQEIESTVREMDPGCEGEAFLTACILAASVVVGPSIKRIAKLLEVPRSAVQVRSERFRSSGIWCGSRVAGAGWFDEETGGCEFWLHVGVGEGWLEAVSN